MQVRKTIKTRGHFPNDDAALRLIWLAVQRAKTTLEWLKAVKELRAAALKQSRIAAYELEHEDGTTETMTPAMILDMLINGAVFHSDTELRERWKKKKLGGWKSPPLVLISLVTIWDLIRMFQAVDQVVEKILYSPALVPPSAANP